MRGIFVSIYIMYNMYPCLYMYAGCICISLYTVLYVSMSIYVCRVYLYIFIYCIICIHVYTCMQGVSVSLYILFICIHVYICMQGVSVSIYIMYNMYLCLYMYAGCICISLYTVLYVSMSIYVCRVYLYLFI